MLAGRPAPAAPTPSGTPSSTPSATVTPAPAPSPSAPGTAQAAGETAAVDPDDRGDQPWVLWTIPAVIVVGALGIGLGLRRRSP